MKSKYWAVKWETDEDINIRVTSNKFSSALEACKDLYGMYAPNMVVLSFNTKVECRKAIASGLEKRTDWQRPCGGSRFLQPKLHNTLFCLRSWTGLLEVEMVPGAYSMAVTNVAKFIRDPRRNKSEGLEGGIVNAYEASSILAIAFCKRKEEVLADILSVK